MQKQNKVDSQILVNDGERYSITISDYFHEKNYVIYVIGILDQCFNEQYKLCFRYKSLRSIHDNIAKDEKLKAILPEFPKTRSFLFVNRTNKNFRNIQDRARELQYYFSKLLNNNELINHYEIKNLMSKAKKSFPEKKRSKSQIQRNQNLSRRSSSPNNIINKSSYNSQNRLTLEYL